MLDGPGLQRRIWPPACCQIPEIGSVYHEAELVYYSKNLCNLLFGEVICSHLRAVHLGYFGQLKIHRYFLYILGKITKYIIAAAKTNFLHISRQTRFVQFIQLSSSMS